MFKPTKHHAHLHHEDLLTQKFSLLCWNVQKMTQQTQFDIFLHELEHHYDVDMMMLQEAKVDPETKLHLKGYSYVLSPNIETKKALFGVLTAAKSHYRDYKSVLTNTQESLWATHKSVLYTYHHLVSEEELLVVNIHAINFMPNFWFKKELHKIRDEVVTHEGPMIIAGDFNSWNKTRMRYLEAFAQELGLEFAAIKEPQHVKKMIRYHLDHILYRGLNLIDAQALDSGKLSDHNPIHATFEVVL